MRKCTFKINRLDTLQFGLFHEWFTKQYPIGELKGPNGHAAGQVSELKAVVEDTNGKIFLVDPEYIVFT